MRRLASLWLVLLAALPVPAAEAGPRVVSLNLCLDQLVLALAAPEQIVGLSRYARDARLSYRAETARAFPPVAGAETILFLKPDLVLTGRYAAPATRASLTRAGIRVEAFDSAATLAETRALILRLGALLERQEAAQNLVLRLDAATETLRGAAPAGLAVLVLARRGYVSGRASLPGELLTLAGASIVAPGVPARHGGFASLEALLAARPDAVLITGARSVAEDQGSALLEHPALTRLLPAARRLYLPDYLTVCGGPGLIEAMETLAPALHRMSRRGATP